MKLQLFGLCLMNLSLILVGILLIFISLQFVKLEQDFTMQYKFDQVVIATLKAEERKIGYLNATIYNRIKE